MAAKKKTPKPTENATDKPVETKEQKLVRLANKRVAKALTAIRLIGNLAAYKPTEADIEKIMTALGEACANVQNKLEGTKTTSYTFSLH